jgi:hypothetical protein
MSCSPLLSVVVPTHERGRYVVPTVKALVANLPDSEIIVSDTSKTDNLSEPLSAWTSEGRVRLVRPAEGKTVSVVDNFRAGCQLARGEFMVFIGDDDFVHASAENIARWAQGQGVEAVRCTFPASYYWPDFHSRFFGAGYAGKLAIKPYTGASTPIDAKAAYRAAMADLGAGVMQMPRAYLGMVSKRCIDRIEARHGSLFGGVSPDIYSAALIANEAKSVVEIDFPFIVPGSSGASTSGQSAKGTHKGKLRDNAHIAPFVDLEWDPLVPEFYSVPTVWGYSLLKAAERLGDRERAGFSRLYARCLLGHADYAAETRQAIRAYAHERGTVSTWAGIGSAITAELAAQARRVLRRVLHPSATAGAHTISNVANCLQASTALSAHIARMAGGGAALDWAAEREDTARRA